MSEVSNLSTTSIDKDQIMLNLENVLFIEDRINMMNERLK